MNARLESRQEGAFGGGSFEFLDVEFGGVLKVGHRLLDRRSLADRSDFGARRRGRLPCKSQRNTDSQPSYALSAAFRDRVKVRRSVTNIIASGKKKRLKAGTNPKKSLDDRMDWNQDDEIAHLALEARSKCGARITSQVAHNTRRTKCRSSKRD